MAASKDSGKDKAPIIIINKKIQAAGHHGGAWKVAYADFVTAMMAFFMVMWLITQMPEEKLAGISEYFLKASPFAAANPTPTKGALGEGGAGDAPVEIFRNVTPQTGEGEANEATEAPEDYDPESANEPRPPTEEEIAAEAQQLDELMQRVKEAIESSESLKAFQEQLLIDITPEGLRIQIVDKQNRPMFDIGSFRLQSYTISIINELAPYVNEAPNRISITGHTDVRPFVGGNTGYTNWELSADRANAARRALINGGMDPAKIARVVGSADTVLFDREDPTNPINRRISIIIMNKRAEQAAMEDAGPDQSEQLPQMTEPATLDGAAPADEGESGDATTGEAPPGLPATAAASTPQY